jgi:hypothetical protein
MQPMIQSLSAWLAGTELSRMIAGTFWAVPLIQTVHILGIAVLMTTVGLLNFRILGIGSRSQPVQTLFGRFLPWIWRALVVQVISGTLLILADPARELGSTLFWLKMGLLLAVVGLMHYLWREIAKHSACRNPAAGFSRLKLLAVVSLLLWIAVLSAGRWIAYVDLG